MCVKEFIGYSCGHCAVPVLRQCPLAAQNEHFPNCKFIAERPTFMPNMCHPCTRVVWNRMVLKREEEHKRAHKAGLCECETIFDEDERERRFGMKVKRYGGGNAVSGLTGMANADGRFAITSPDGSAFAARPNVGLGVGNVHAIGYGSASAATSSHNSPYVTSRDLVQQGHHPFGAYSPSSDASTTVGPKAMIQYGLGPVHYSQASHHQQVHQGQIYHRGQVQPYGVVQGQVFAHPGNPYGTFNPQPVGPMTYPAAGQQFMRIPSEDDQQHHQHTASGVGMMSMASIFPPRAQPIYSASRTLASVSDVRQVQDETHHEAALVPLDRLLAGSPFAEAAGPGVSEMLRAGAQSINDTQYQIPNQGGVPMGHSISHDSALLPAAFIAQDAHEAGAMLVSRHMSMGPRPSTAPR